jgi:hypothetical protein
VRHTQRQSDTAVFAEGVRKKTKKTAATNNTQMPMWQQCQKVILDDISKT